MSQTIIAKKKQDVDELVEKIKTAKSFLVFEYLGLNVKDLTKMRVKLHLAKAMINIIKNNILNRALKIANIDAPTCIGPNAILICNDDEIIGFHILKETMKNKSIKFKFGFLEKKIIQSNQFEEIASIPNRQNLYTMLLSCFTSPIRNFLYGLKAISKTKK